MEVSGQLYILAALPLKKEAPVPLDRMLSGSQSWSGHNGEEKNTVPSGI